MSTLGEHADGYEPKKTPTVADLEAVSLSQEIIEKKVPYKEKDAEGKEIIVEKVESFINVNGILYRIPPSVLEQIQEIRKVKPDTKTVKVTSKGTGLSTKYQTMQLE